MNSDTPRTDKLVVVKPDSGKSGWLETSEYVRANFARMLERENNQLRRELEDWDRAAGAWNCLTPLDLIHKINNVLKG